MDGNSRAYLQLVILHETGAVLWELLSPTVLIRGAECLSAGWPVGLGTGQKEFACDTLVCLDRTITFFDLLCWVAERTAERTRVDAQHA